MANITSEMVKELRQSTGAGMMDCKKALTECEGDMEKAKEYLRKKGLAAVAKKTGRIAAEGRINTYIHGEGKIGVMIEVNCETDFAAKTDDFKELVHQLSLQIAASNPTYIVAEEIPADLVAKEKEIHAAQLRDQKKPDAIIDKIVEGKLSKWHQEICLMNQPFIFEEKQSVDDLVKNVSAKIGEKISVRRFARWELGEGLEKRVYDLASEVAAEMNK
ncbi:translation elongation factor Ts [Myxococcota bacterium]|nr:translation elongation factor Ts [Myxococcota bacterium]MBU1379307.1 translation elongation factor Ts [Myxococcota bacterium]MBU1498799.1 translation elongation factor Ts [Myxococcota bacterium]